MLINGLAYANFTSLVSRKISRDSLSLLRDVMIPCYGNLLLLLNNFGLLDVNKLEEAYERRQQRPRRGKTIFKKNRNSNV